MPLSDAIREIERLFTQVRDALQDMNKRLQIFEKDSPQTSLDVKDSTASARTPGPVGASGSTASRSTAVDKPKDDVQ